MNRKWFSIAGLFAAAILLLSFSSCAHDQELVGITIQPPIENFGASNIPVTFDAGLSVQLRALGSYIHPPVTKDITDQVTWASNTPDMVSVNSTGLIAATGLSCGGTLVSATVQTNGVGNRSSAGAIITGYMTANVVCFTGSGGGGGGPSITVNFLGTGSGTVTFSPTGIICNASPTTVCMASFASGTTVTLTAAPSGTFGGWSGGCDAVSGSGLVCTVDNLTTSRVLTATFN